jgi:hypothetical protein
MKLLPAQALAVIEYVDRDRSLSRDLDLLIALDRFIALEGNKIFAQSLDRDRLDTTG